MSTSRRTAVARIPSLDGLRAISIALVVFYHAVGTHGAPMSVETASAWIDWGNLGVRVFFVISGFLISRLLFLEEDRTGTISLRTFYWRRTMRIFPAYFAFLAVVWAASAAGLVGLGHNDLLHAFTYTTNYHRDGRAWILGHTWSLAVEEQFYLLWPLTLLLLGRRRALIGALAFVGVAAVMRVVVHIPQSTFFLWLEQQDSNSFETAADAIAVGCLLAGFRIRLWRWNLLRRFYASACFLCVPIVVLAAAGTESVHLVSMFGHARLFYVLYRVISIPIMNLGIALIIDWTIRNADGRVGRILNARPLVFVGTLSYSIYLWQQPFLSRGSSSWWTSFPVNLFLAVVAALASYHLIERPALGLRQRVGETKPATSQGVIAQVVSI